MPSTPAEGVQGIHDSDAAEQASGIYSYAATGATGTLVLNYTGSADFVGDWATVRLTFRITTDGTYVSQYKWNDGVEATIEGRFVLQ